MKEVKTWNNNPRLMWCWDDDESLKTKRKVIYIKKTTDVKYPVMVLDEEELATLYFMHCAEIEPQHRMTNQELSFWLTEKPYREWKSSNDVVFTSFNYIDGNENEKVDDDILIRENGGEWREPLAEEVGQLPNN